MAVNVGGTSINLDSPNDSNRRRDAIAYQLLRLYVKKKGITFTDARREIGNAAKATGIGFKELQDFYREFFYGLIDEYIGK